MAGTRRQWMPGTPRFLWRGGRRGFERQHRRSGPRHEARVGERRKLDDRRAIGTGAKILGPFTVGDKVFSQFGYTANGGNTDFALMRANP